MLVKVNFYAAYREAAGEDSVTLEFSNEPKVSDLLDRLAEKYPPLAPAREFLLAAVNREWAPEDRRLVDGDEVSILPPVTGG